MKNLKKVMIISGEASGDLHGANLVKELNQLYPHLEFFGMGGKCMEQAGVELTVDMTHFSVCGFVEVIRYLPKFYNLFKKIKNQIKERQPDLLILIDFPTFNLRLSGIAKKWNIKTLYYISPQIWAWHTSRVKKIKKNISMMGVIFPFEVDFYQKYSVPVKYVGHPLIDIVPTHLKSDLKDKQTVGLLPGSRKNEIEYLLPVLIETAEMIQKSYPEMDFVLPLADTIREEEIINHLNKSSVNIKLIKNDRYKAMSGCDVVIAASGTVTLELTLLGIPMVIVYKGNGISFSIAKRLVNIPYIGLCNIIAGKKIAAELLQQEANPKMITEEVLRMLRDKQYLEEQKRELRLVANKLTMKKECSIGQLAMQMLLE